MLLWLIVFVGNYSKNIPAAKLFDNTVLLINTYSDDKGEFPGLVADTISQNVFTLIYEFPDTIISKSKKLDILHLMIYNQDYATRVYRAILFDRVKKLDPIVLSHIEFIAPLLFCHYCEDTKALSIVKEYNTINDLYVFPDMYRSYYDYLMRKIATIDVDSPEQKSLKVIYKNTWNSRLLRQKLIDKYPIFKSPDSRSLK